MVQIRPEWLIYSPDDFSGLPVKLLLTQAGVFGRQWRDFWITLHTENVAVDAEEVLLMERLHHAFAVAIKCREPEVMRELVRLNVPVGNIDDSGNALLAASLYENRTRVSE
ncbi:MAG: hypothetical protein ACO3FE_23170 [Planctomycetaceae bacterium]